MGRRRAAGDQDIPADGDPEQPCRVEERFGDILLLEEIRRIRDERGAVILAHIDQKDDVRGCADVVGDDLSLVLKAARSGAGEMVVCAIDLIAETVQLLAPDTRVILPVPEATCPAARQFTPDALNAARERHPGAAVVVDLRSPAECKALADITCTPESAARIIGSLSEERVILALPDPHSSEWVRGRVPGKEILPLSFAVVDASGERSVPPCPGGVRRGSHRGSGLTGAAEALRTVIQEAGNGRAFLARNCTICHGMRHTTLPDLYRSLRTGSPRVEIPGAVLLAARQPVLRMVAVLGRSP